jgi:hypothetical protein
MKDFIVRTQVLYAVSVSANDEAEALRLADEMLDKQDGQEIMREHKHIWEVKDGTPV